MQVEGRKDQTRRVRETDRVGLAVCADFAGVRRQHGGTKLLSNCGLMLNLTVSQDDRLKFFEFLSCQMYDVEIEQS